MAAGTILVVDDTAEILELTSSSLEDAGYAVLRCGDAGEALAVLNDGHAVDLMLTDVTMPGINGFELARQARVARPALIIAYLTGYAAAPSDIAGELLGPILRKPNRRDDLEQQIEQLLAPGEDARLLRAVAYEMNKRHPDALQRAREAAEIEAAKGDAFSGQAWRDIAATIEMLRAKDRSS